MSATILDGKKRAADYRKAIKDIIKENHIGAKLAVIVVGNDPASAVYVRNKEKACAECGILTDTYRFDDTSKEELIALISKLNNDSSVSGILVQLPLPAHLDENEIVRHISATKDVDAFTPIVAAGVYTGYLNHLKPCTPRGIMGLLDSYSIDVSGKNVVVVGRSMTVGKPLAMMMLERNATVTICHSKTTNLKEHTIRADVLVSAVGYPNLITADMVKPGAVVVDVGINRANGKLCGDVDFESVKDVAGFITPVPGGIGPMTIMGLIYNTVICSALNSDD